MNKLIALLILTVFIDSCHSSQQTKQSSNTADGNGAYATGSYRNLFAENGYSEKDITDRLDAAYQQLFHGDTTQTIYFEAGRNDTGLLAYVSDVYHNDIRSEGMSYGMMISVQMDKKADFDAIWNYAMTYMYENRPEHPSQGYFRWSLKRTGIANDETPAPDGEEYFVMALYFAANRWGNGKGIYNYKAWADTILNTMRHHPLRVGETKNGRRTIGNMVHEEEKKIRFVPGSDRASFTDPSYHLPAFYELWARWGPKPERAFWAAAADTSRNYFIRATNNKSGLAPDYSNFDGTPLKQSRNPNAGNFSYDSWRTAMNWSVDWNWWKKDPRQQELSNRLQSFFASKGMDTYGCQYTLDGEVVGQRHAKGLIATNASAGLAATHPAAKDFVKALWNTPVPAAIGERYYDGLLYIMSFLHCSGRFKIWGPKG